MKHVSIIIRGLVQGVSFRYYTSQKARELNIGGWVRNAPDDSVHIEAEGEEENLNKFIAWCHDGPEASTIKKVDYNFSSPRDNFIDFKIKF